MYQCISPILSSLDYQLVLAGFNTQEPGEVRANMISMRRNDS